MKLSQKAVLRALPIGVAVSLIASGAASARSLTVRDAGYLRFVTSSGDQVIDEGSVRGTLPGKTRVHFTYNGNPIVYASFVITGTGWSLYGRANCRLSNPNSSAPSFRGALTLTGGAGRYARAHGSGELFGVFSRRSYALDVQAIGRLFY
jgi:hypothetical protein